MLTAEVVFGYLLDRSAHVGPACGRGDFQVSVHRSLAEGASPNAPFARLEMLTAERP
jgi:hypothetical protein